MQIKIKKTWGLLLCLLFLLNTRTTLATETTDSSDESEAKYPDTGDEVSSRKAHVHSGMQAKLKSNWFKGDPLPKVYPIDLLSAPLKFVEKEELRKAEQYKKLREVLDLEDPDQEYHTLVCKAAFDFFSQKTISEMIIIRGQHLCFGAYSEAVYSSALFSIKDLIGVMRSLIEAEEKEVFDQIKNLVLANEEDKKTFLCNTILAFAQASDGSEKLKKLYKAFSTEEQKLKDALKEVLATNLRSQAQAQVQVAQAQVQVAQAQAQAQVAQAQAQAQVAQAQAQVAQAQAQVAQAQAQVAQAQAQVAQAQAQVAQAQALPQAIYDSLEGKDEWKEDFTGELKVQRLYGPCKKVKLRSALEGNRNVALQLYLNEKVSSGESAIFSLYGEHNIPGADYTSFLDNPFLKADALKELEGDKYAALKKAFPLEGEAPIEGEAPSKEYEASEARLLRMKALFDYLEQHKTCIRTMCVDMETKTPFFIFDDGEGTYAVVSWEDWKEAVKVGGPFTQSWTEYFQYWSLLLEEGVLDKYLKVIFGVLSFLCLYRTLEYTPPVLKEPTPASE